MALADISLLSEDRLVLVCMASTALMTLVLAGQRREWFTKRLPYHIAGALIVGIVLWLWLQRAFPQDTIPLTLVAWTGWLCLGVSIAFTVRRSHKRLLVAATNGLLAILFALLLANSYYQFYPTLGSLFGAAPVTDRDGKSYEHANAHLVAHPTEALYTSPTSMPTAGHMDVVTITGGISHFKPRTSFVYVPPAGLADSQLKLPVLVGLAGVPGSPGDWTDRIQFETTLNAFAATHHGLAPIVVVADQTGGSGFEDTACVDSSRGNVETYLTKDIPAYMQQHYHVARGSASWAIGGFSDGGMCSMVLALRHPDIYHAFVSLSGAPVPSDGSRQQTLSTFFDGSLSEYKAHDARAILANIDVRRLAQTAGWLAVGRDEQQSLVQDNHDVFERAKADGMDITLELLNGHHSFGLWKDGFADVLPWLSYHLGLTTCDGSCKK